MIIDKNVYKKKMLDPAKYMTISKDLMNSILRKTDGRVYRQYIFQQKSISTSIPTENIYLLDVTGFEQINGRRRKGSISIKSMEDIGSSV